MKIDKRNPAHWMLLCGFLATGLAGLVMRLATRHRARQRVLFYGHKLNGNLLAIYRELAAATPQDLMPVFLTLDRRYHRQLRARGLRSVWACGPGGAWALAHAAALISDHALHSLGLLLGAWQKLGLRFFDVWHGIPFKGFDADDFRLQHRYDEVWVASPLMQKLYVERYGFDADKVQVTGYARTDRLVTQDADITAIKRSFGLDGANVGKIVLFAPTWKQDARERSIYPFGVDERAFLEALSALAQRTASTIVMRTHLNSGNVAAGAWARIVQRPLADFPDTEALLLASDVLVCDWSSIAFDWLLLDRPTLFLDVEPPFAKPLSLDRSYRYGAIVDSLPELLERLNTFLITPQAYAQAFTRDQSEVRMRVYGPCADGQATARCANRLLGRSQILQRPSPLPRRSCRP